MRQLSATAAAIGVGVFILSVNDTEGGGEGLAFQIGAGVAFQASKQVAIFADYRYRAAPDAELTSAGVPSVELDIGIHTFMPGLRIFLGGG